MRRLRYIHRWPQMRSHSPFVKAAYPEDFANRDDDKFNYRYRGRYELQLPSSAR